MPDQPLPARGLAEQEKLQFDVCELFEQKITFNQFLGFKVTTLRADKVCIEFPMRPEHIGHYLHGRLHGGVISSALDATGGLAVLWANSNSSYNQHESSEQVLKRFSMLGTIDLRIDYLRQGIGDRFCASATVVRLGRRIGSTQMQLENQDGVLLATGNGTYMLS